MVSATTVSTVSAAATVALASITDKAYYMLVITACIAIEAESSAVSATKTNSFAIAEAGFRFIVSLCFVAFLCPLSFTCRCVSEPIAPSTTRTCRMIALGCSWSHKGLAPAG